MCFVQQKRKKKERKNRKVKNRKEKNKLREKDEQVWLTIVKPNSKERKKERKEGRNQERRNLENEREWANKNYQANFLNAVYLREV